MRMQYGVSFYTLSSNNLAPADLARKLFQLHPDYVVPRDDDESQIARRPVLRRGAVRTFHQPGAAGLAVLVRVC